MMKSHLTRFILVPKNLVKSDKNKIMAKKERQHGRIYCYYSIYVDWDNEGCTLIRAMKPINIAPTLKNIKHTPTIAFLMPKNRPYS